MSPSCRRGSLLGSALLFSFLFATLLVLFVVHDDSAAAMQLKAVDLQLCAADEDNGDSGQGIDTTGAIVVPAPRVTRLPEMTAPAERRPAMPPVPLYLPEARAPPLRF